MTPFINNLIANLKLQNKDDIVNAYKKFTKDYLEMRSISYKSLEFDSFHPFFYMVLKEKNNLCKFETVYCNENSIISLLLIRGNIDYLEKEILLYNFYDEVSSMITSNYYLDPENHFTTNLEINKFSNTNLSQNSDEWEYYFLEGKVEEAIPNRKVIIHSTVYYVNLTNNVFNHEKYCSFRIIFKSGKPIKF